MDHGSSDRVPASALILLASVFFTLLTFTTYKVLWGIPIPIYFLIGVLGLQFASLLLGSSKILTQLGAASLSALIAVAAAFGSVFLLFPPLLKLRIAGIAGNVLALIFIMASFVAASREDPLPSIAPEPLNFDDLVEENTVELIKYGEVKAPDTDYGNGLPITGRHWEEAEEEYTRSGDEIITTFEPQADKSLFEEFSSPGGWVDETARVMAYDESGDEHSLKTVNENNRGEIQTAVGGLSGLNLRTRFKVLDSSSGEHYGTFYGDEGYSTLDLVSLTGLIGSRLEAGELRIIKLDWSNFDEIEVHVRVEDVLPIDLDHDAEESTGKSDVAKGQDIEGVEDLSGNRLPDQSQSGELSSTVSPSSVRYTIYDRRTIQPMAEYVPDGDRSRIDRLTLYKMFPEYDFKTFEIDSIRWESDEVRIFIKGMKKGLKSNARDMDNSHTQGDLLDDEK